MAGKPKDSPRKIARHAAALREEGYTAAEQATLKPRIIRLLKGGCTLTEICGRKDMPSYPTVTTWRDEDTDFAAMLERAMWDGAEVILKDSADLAREEAEKAKPDANRVQARRMWADVASRYAAAIAPKRFGALSKLGVDGDAGVQLHVVSFSQLTPINSADAQPLTRAHEPTDARQRITHQSHPDSQTQSQSGASNGRAGRGNSGRKVPTDHKTRTKPKSTKARA